ncbi:MAG TPA: hypothetical protein VGQ57_07040 [Polyangiaceae bacterium]|nr:hypothetical protein [Polyangiaceae bacterium]
MRGRAWKLLCGSLLLGCGSDPVSAPIHQDTEPAKCDTPPGYVDLSYPALDVGEVVVSVHTTDGSPADHALVEVCGINACTNPTYTDERGDADVAVQVPTQKPALKYGDAFEFGELALLFEVSGHRTDFGSLYTTKLPDTGDPIQPGKRAESNGVALTLAENGTFDLPGFAPYDTEDGRGLRAAELPQEHWPAGLDHGAGLELVFTLAPMGAMLCPSPAVELPNSAGWAPGTAVEFLQQGLDAGADEGAQLFAPYGEWTSFGTGTVDDTGERLVQTEGGLAMISNVGVRRL